MFSITTTTVALSILLVSLVGESLAYTEAENLQYIEKILSHFNNQDKCELPNYDAIDVLLMSFEDLAKIRGPNAESKLTNDQKMLTKTVLYQWASFQRYLRTGPAGTVNSSAKLLGYVSKVIEYQKMKYGSSVCEDERDRRFHDGDDDDDDGEFQKNPLVRYLKHLRQANKARRFKPKANFKMSETAKAQVENNPEPIPKVESNQNVGVETQGLRPFRGRFIFHSNLRPSSVSFALQP